ncbi:MAG: DUF5050 domain-containing protein [Myxococcota bacterium]|nr:DUF5050 domain-containing protein [Deltaproteobacteria bacterium]MDQ3336826.1 DUF5050 domain-containing protein [Myxococcota bacterium]
MRSVVVALLLAACGQPVAKKVERLPPADVPPPVAEKPVPPKRPARVAFSVAPSPTSIAIQGDQLYWTDALGSIWTMPSTGGTPRQLSDQRSPDFAFKVVSTGTGVVASTRKDLLRVGETVTKLNIRGLVEYPEEIVADEAFVYITMFKKSQIMRVPIGGGNAQQIGDLARGVLALHGDTLYVVSYANGVLVAIPKAGGKPRTIAKGLVRPTALAADATHAFVYSEKDKTVQSIELATGAATVIAKNLVNSDDMVADGAWLYTRSWDKGSKGTLVRIAKDGSSQTAIGADLAAPYNIAFDADAIYVTARDGAQIVRFEKAALAP